MIIGLTGHTKGFGPLIKNHFEDKGNTVIGFSRTNGYDIKSRSSRDKILDHEFDILINNAVSGFGQTALLVQCCIKDINIVSIGSNITQLETVSLKYRKEWISKCNLLECYKGLNWGKYISWGYHNGITDDYPELLDNTTIDQALFQLYEVCHNRRH